MNTLQDCLHPRSPVDVPFTPVKSNFKESNDSNGNAQQTKQIQRPIHNYPAIPERTLLGRIATSAQAIICSLSNWERTEFLFTEEFIDRLFNKKDFSPNTLYVVRANLAKEGEHCHCSSITFNAYNMLVDPSFHGTVDLSNRDIDYWPDKLRINGTLNLSGSSITELPKTLIVDKDLNISNCANLTSLSENKITVVRDLIARNCGLQTIDTNFKAGNADFTGCSALSKLGNRFVVKRLLVL